MTPHNIQLQTAARLIQRWGTNFYVGLEYPFNKIKIWLPENKHIYSITANLTSVRIFLLFFSAFWGILILFSDLICFDFFAKGSTCSVHIEVQLLPFRPSMSHCQENLEQLVEVVLLAFVCLKKHQPGESRNNMWISRLRSLHTPVMKHENPVLRGSQHGMQSSVLHFPIINFY